MSYLCNFYFIISLIYRAFAKYRKKSKIHRPFWGDFTVEEAKYILKQPPGNDHCGFYVMHYMHCYTGDCRSAEMVCMKWLIDICSCVLNYLTCLISCCCDIFFQNTELDSGELLMGKLVALQEELAGWLVDYVVKPGSEYSII